MKDPFLLKQGLEMNKEDAWSTHSMAHVLEMTGRQKAGISFLSSTVQDWSVRRTCGFNTFPIINYPKKTFNTKNTKINVRK